MSWRDVRWEMIDGRFVFWGIFLKFGKTPPFAEMCGHHASHAHAKLIVRVTAFRRQSHARYVYLSIR